MEQILNQLVERLRKTYEDRLVAVVLYGSAAVGDHHGKFSDINILCVLSKITTRELVESSPIFRWWRQQDNPSPLLLTLDEVKESTDCFPIEFHDIRERHRVLYGEDVVRDLEVDYSFYRAQVEHELRAKMLRLRQKAAGALGDRDLLLRLMADSLSTFCVLIRHALLLCGAEARFEKRPLVEQARDRFGIDPAPFNKLLDLREGAVKPRDINAVPLFESYLEEIHTVVNVVDRIQK